MAHAAYAQVVGLQTDEVTSPQFAVDRQVEHCEVALARIDLKSGPDIPDFLWFEQAFLTDESPFIPVRMQTVLLSDVGLGRGSNLPIQPLPPQLPALPSMKYNAEAGLTLRTADNGRSKSGIGARSAPKPDIRR